MDGSPNILSTFPATPHYKCFEFRAVVDRHLSGTEDSNFYTQPNLGFFWDPNMSCVDHCYSLCHWRSTRYKMENQHLLSNDVFSFEASTMAVYFWPYKQTDPSLKLQSSPCWLLNVYCNVGSHLDQSARIFPREFSDSASFHSGEACPCGFTHSSS